MTRPIDPNKAVDHIITNAKKFAQAKADRVYLEEYRKTKKALLMKDSKETSSVAKEMDAYAHPEYQEVLNGIRAAIEVEETLKWELIAAQARVEVWRTQEATARAEGRATQ